MLTDRPFIFSGEYSEMLRFLARERGVINPHGINIFNRFLDCMMVSAAIGISKSQYVSIDSITEKNDVAKVLPEQMINENSTINYLYALAMLDYKKDPKTGEAISIDDRINRAFRVPNTKLTTPEEKSQAQICYNIFKGYVFGGLKYIYNYFKASVSSQ